MPYNRFFRSLPEKTTDEIEDIQRAMVLAYNKFISSGYWRLDQTGSHTELSFDVKVLDEVLQEMIKIKGKLVK